MLTIGTDSSIDHTKFAKYDIIQDGSVIATVYGPGSLSVATHICETYENFNFYEWVSRAMFFMKKNKELQKMRL